MFLTSTTECSVSGGIFRELPAITLQNWLSGSKKEGSPLALSSQRVPPGVLTLTHLRLVPAGPKKLETKTAMETFTL